MSQYDEQIQTKAQEIFEAQRGRELEKGATDNQAADRAREMADKYADDMHRIISR
jgi:hypothetical protein